MTRRDALRRLCGLSAAVATAAALPAAAAVLATEPEPRGVLVFEGAFSREDVARYRAAWDDLHRQPIIAVRAERTRIYRV